MTDILVYIPPRDDDPPPTPTAPALPPLMLLECEACEGETGYNDDCRTCYGSGSFEVCLGCLRRPWVTAAGLEACGCEPGPVCELCTRPAERLNAAGICESCHRQGVEQLEQEADEHDALIHAEVEWALKNTSWLGAVA